MINITDYFSLKSKVYKLKLSLDNEPSNIEEKRLADKYLSQVLFLLEELR